MLVTCGRARRGVGLRLARAFRRWVVELPLMFVDFYCRPGRNIAAGDIPRASAEELAIWGELSRWNALPHARMGEFGIDIQIRDGVANLLGCVAPSLRDTVQPNPCADGGVVEWEPSGITLQRAAHQLGFKSKRISRWNSKMAKVHTSQGLRVYADGGVALIGGLSGDFRETRQFSGAFNSARRNAGLLIIPALLIWRKWDSTPFRLRVASVLHSMATFWQTNGMLTRSGSATIILAPRTSLVGRL